MQKSIKIPVQSLNSEAILPKYAYEGDAGFDLCSCQNCNIKPGERAIIHCGFAIEIPDGYAGLIIPRSGLAAKHGISVVNSPGLIDSGYRGEICVILINTDTQNDFEICVGDRIAQMMIIPFANCQLIPSDSLSDSQRQDKKFGSSGTKSLN